MKNSVLLAMNRTLTGAPDGPSPFRLASSRMPRFGRAEAAPAPVAAAAESPFRRVSSGEGRDEAGGQDAVATSVLPSRPLVASVAMASRTKRRPARASVPSLVGLPSRWFGRRRSRDRALVQGELSLETVRVVRNDLRDADYEVVRPARAVVARLRQADPIDAPPTLAIGAWRRWVGAFFRMGI